MIKRTTQKETLASGTYGPSKISTNDQTETQKDLFDQVK
jgi:hypothetical protein